jgi:hypothetical protein
MEQNQTNEASYEQLRREALFARRRELEGMLGGYQSDGLIDLKGLADIASNMAELNGFHDGEKHVPGIAGIPHMIGLNCSEFGEIVERARKNPEAMDEHVPGRTNLEVECADVLIRLLDMVGHCDHVSRSSGSPSVLSIDGFVAAILEKMVANANRPFRHGKNL